MSDQSPDCPRCFIENKPCARHNPDTCPDPAHTPTLTDEQRAELAEHEPVIAATYATATGPRGFIVGCSCLSARDYRAAGYRGGQEGWRNHQAEVIARMVADAERRGRAEAESLHRDLTTRLGFGDNITEPQADNDTIVAWFEERGRDADEWVESQLWRNDCYAAGHPDDEDCPEHDPWLVAERGGYERGRAEVSAAVEAVLSEPYAYVGPDREPFVLSRSVRAALTNPAAAVAQIKAEARDEALLEAAAMLDRRASGGTAYNAAAREVRALRACADRIGGESDG